MTLTRNIQVTKKVPVRVTSFRWSGGALTEGYVACGFKCCACGGKLGARRFGVAFDGDRKQSMRLCEDCSLKAEASVVEETEAP